MVTFYTFLSIVLIVILVWILVDLWNQSRKIRHLLQRIQELEEDFDEN